MQTDLPDRLRWWSLVEDVSGQSLKTYTEGRQLNAEHSKSWNSARSAANLQVHLQLDNFLPFDRDRESFGEDSTNEAAERLQTRKRRGGGRGEGRGSTLSQARNSTLIFQNVKLLCDV